MNRKAFTLIELLIVLTVVFMVAALIFGVVYKHSGPSKQFTAEVLEKWTDLDENNDRVYRLRTRTETGEVEAWESSSVHDQVKIGQWYKFEAKRTYLRKAEFVPSEPVKKPKD